MRLAAPVRLLSIALWVGSLWTVGYLVAPTLFMTLADTVLAGTIAGKLFRIEAWLSVAAALMLIVLIASTVTESRQRNTLTGLVGAMLACTLIGYFGLQPFMASLREAAPGGVLAGVARTQFGMLHGLASALYLVESILGIFLVLKHAQVDLVHARA